MSDHRELLRDVAFLLGRDAKPCPRWKKGVGDCDLPDCDPCRVTRAVNQLEAALDQPDAEDDAAYARARYVAEAKAAGAIPDPNYPPSALAQQEQGVVRDAELTKLCAEAMGLDFDYDDTDVWVGTEPDSTQYAYYPLANDAQAMALDQYILAADYCISYARDECEIYPTEGQTPEAHRPLYYSRLDMTKPENRRRVRVECVAKMQKEKKAPATGEGKG